MRVPESVLLLRSQPRREEVVVGLARDDLPRVGSTVWSPRGVLEFEDRVVAAEGLAIEGVAPELDDSANPRLPDVAVLSPHCGCLLRRHVLGASYIIGPRDDNDVAILLCEFTSHEIRPVFS